MRQFIAGRKRGYRRAKTGLAQGENGSSQGRETAYLVLLRHCPSWWGGANAPSPDDAEPVITTRAPLRSSSGARSRDPLASPENHEASVLVSRPRPSRRLLAQAPQDEGVKLC